MTILTLGQVKTEVRTILGGRSDVNARLTSIINMAQMRLARLHDFEELRSIIIIQNQLTADPGNDKILPLLLLGEFRKIYSVRIYADNTQSRKLEKVLPKQWDKFIPEPEYYSRGTPTHYTMWGKTQLELWRVPDMVYRVHMRYSRWPYTLFEGQDGEYLDLRNVDDIIIHLAASYAAMSFGNIEKSNELYRIYAALARETINEDIEEFDTHMGSMKPQFNALNRGYDDPFVQSIEMPND